MMKIVKIKFYIAISLLSMIQICRSCLLETPTYDPESPKRERELESVLDQ